MIYAMYANLYGNATNVASAEQECKFVFIPAVLSYKRYKLKGLLKDLLKAFF
jgi:hypothetical protein